jgi:hypothetical protein
MAMSDEKFLSCVNLGFNRPYRHVDKNGLVSVVPCYGCGGGPNVCTARTDGDSDKSQKTYIIFDSVSCAFKIGKSIDPRRRLDDIKTHNPNDLILVRVYEQDIESKLKKLVWDFRIRGEWFRATKACVAALRITQEEARIMLQREVVTLNEANSEEDKESEKYAVEREIKERRDNLRSLLEVSNAVDAEIDACALDPDLSISDVRCFGTTETVVCFFEIWRGIVRECLQLDDFASNIVDDGEIFYDNVDRMVPMLTSHLYRSIYLIKVNKSRKILELLVNSRYRDSIAMKLMDAASALSVVDWVILLSPVSHAGYRGKSVSAYMRSIEIAERHRVNAELRYIRDVISLKNKRELLEKQDAESGECFEGLPEMELPAGGVYGDTQPREVVPDNGLDA